MMPTRQGWVALSLCIVLAGAPLTAAAGEVTVGVAKEAFVLPKGVPLAGYSRRKGRPSRGLHDPVGVRAIVLQDGHTAVALASADLLIVDERLFDAVRRRLAAEGVPGSLTLLVAAIHTHSGPGAYGGKLLEKISMGHFDPAVFEAIVAATARAVSQAYADRAPAQLVLRSGQTEGLAVNRVEAGGWADGEVTVTAFYRTGMPRPFAVIVGFAAHPTTLGAWNWQLSADYPGVVMREVERRLPGATCLFFAGAVGDQAPVKSGDGFERAERVGGPIAARALALLDGAGPEPVGGIGASQDVVPLPPARVRLGRRVVLPRWLGRRLVDDDATLTVVTVGPAVFFGVPCDLSSALGRELKRAADARGLAPRIVGFADDYIGYCMPESVYRSGAYEALMAFNGPAAGELTVQRLIRMLDEAVRRGQ